MVHPVQLQDDTLGLNAAQREILAAAVDLELLDVPELIAHREVPAGPDNEAGHVHVECFTGPKIDRMTLYRFHRAGVLNEHLCHVWPASGYDFPALTTVVFEMRDRLVLGADLIPIADVVFTPTYYGEYLLGFAGLLEEFWPRIVAHRTGPEPAPSPYFTHQVGSTLSVLEYLREDGLDVATEFLLELTRLYTRVHAAAQPDPAHRAGRTEERRVAVMTKAYKGLDYHSPAANGLSSVLGWTGANLMFDAVFGPDDPPQVMDARRRYLDVEVSPGTPTPTGDVLPRR